MVVAGAGCGGGALRTGRFSGVAADAICVKAMIDTAVTGAIVNRMMTPPMPERLPASSRRHPEDMQTLISCGLPGDCDWFSTVKRKIAASA